MSNEITEQFSLHVENGSYEDRVDTGQLSFDQAAQGRGGTVQSIDTTEETIDFGDVVYTEGKMYVRNLDITNYVDLGGTFTTGNAELCHRLKAGEWMWIRIVPTAVWRAKADTLACLIDVRLYAD